MADKLFIIDEDTGEVKTERKLKDTDEVKIRSREQQEYFKNKTDLGKMESDLGGFYMLYYNKRLFDGLISQTHIARIIYLATYIEYDTNKLVFHENGQKNIPFTERDIKKILGIKDRQTFYDFKKEVLDSDIMIIQDDGIYMSKKYFNKGKDNSNSYFMKMYIDTIQQLYRQINTRQHKTLGYLFQLIPFIDYEFNIITRYPHSEQALEHLMIKEDIAELLKVDLETYKKIEKQLLKLVITFRDKTYPLIGDVSIRALNVETNRLYKTNYYVVNPLIYSSINDYSIIEEINSQLWLRLSQKKEIDRNRHKKK